MLFVVRHGLKAYLIDKPVDPDTILKPYDVPLTQVGHEQALKTGQYIKYNSE